jgi:hypothetical protein
MRESGLPVFPLDGFGQHKCITTGKQQDGHGKVSGFFHPAPMPCLCLQSPEAEIPGFLNPFIKCGSEAGALGGYFT